MTNIQSLLLDGHSWTEICKQVGCTRKTVANHAKKLKRGETKSQNKIDWGAVQEFSKTHSRNETLAEFKISLGFWRGALRQGLVETKKIKFDLNSVATENSTYSRGRLKERIIKNKLIPYSCSVCSRQPIWESLPLVLILDHINGKHNDHRLENLRFVCPNCNSQLSTFAGRNTKKK